MSESIGFCYLKTGGGHSSGAHSLAVSISSMYPNAKCFFFDPFEKSAFLSSLFFEKGYFLTSNYFMLLYLLFYRITSYRIVLNFCQLIYRRFFVRRFVRFLRKEKISKIVCLHEILICHIREAIDKVDPSIKLISIVMDPFTAHPIWFYEKQTHLIVFSSKLKKEAVERYGFMEDNVHTFSLMLSDQFNKPFTDEEKQKVREKFKIPKDKKIVLIAGGGEGLKNAARLVFFFLRRGFKDHMIVVCGKNKKLKRLIDMMAKRYNAKNIHVFGFVSFMPSLMNIADCIVSKSGPATIMEALSLYKPLILCSYIRGQELGNMLFVKLNNVGWYLPKSLSAVKKVEELLSGKLKFSQDNIKALNIKNGVKDIANFVMAL